MTYGFISVNDHVQETPEVWTSRLSKAKWGDRIPQLRRNPDGADQWVVDGQVLLGGRVAQANALLGDRNGTVARWEDVPRAAYAPKERLTAMDAAGVDRSVLFPTVAGMAG